MAKTFLNLSPKFNIFITALLNLRRSCDTLCFLNILAVCVYRERGHAFLACVLLDNVRMQGLALKETGVLFWWEIEKEKSSFINIASERIEFAFIRSHSVFCQFKHCMRFISSLKATLNREWQNCGKPHQILHKRGTAGK